MKPVQKFEPLLNPYGISLTNISAILVAARDAGVEGPVAYHLVGAKLELRFPDDAQTDVAFADMAAGQGVNDDYKIGDTAFRVVTEDSEIAKALADCKDAIRGGHRVLLLVPADLRASAQRSAEHAGLDGYFSVQGVAAFVATNLDEIAKYRPDDLASGLIAFLIVYNDRVQQVEADRSLLIKVPVLK